MKKTKARKLLAAAALTTGAVLTEGCPLPLPGISGVAVDRHDAGDWMDAGDAAGAGDAGARDGGADGRDAAAKGPDGGADGPGAGS
jgi:hypothetical protein